MASTIERKAAEIVKVFVFSRKASLTTARPRSMKKSAGGSQSPARDNRPAVMAEPARRAAWAATSARSLRDTAPLIGSNHSDLGRVRPRPTGSGSRRPRLLRFAHIRANLHPLRTPPFGRLLASYTLNSIGDYVGLVALALLVYEETRDPLATAARRTPAGTASR